MTVYIELIFLDNFLLDTLLLWLVSRFSPKKPFIRLLTIGALGGIYAVFASCFPQLASLPSKIFFGFIMILLCFPRSCMKSFLLFSVFAMLLGGITFAMQPELISEQGTVTNRGRLMLIGCFLITLIMEFLSRTGFSPSESITVELYFNGACLIFTAEYDSGCTVKDRSGNAVILLDKRFFEKNLNTDITDLQHAARRFTVTTASGTTQLLGIKPQKILLKDKKHSYRSEAWIVIADQIDLNGSPAIFGKGLIIESEEIKCRHFSESAFSDFSHFFRKIAVTISTAANRFRRRSPKKKSPPSL